MHWFLYLKWRMPENTEVIVCLFCFGIWEVFFSFFTKNNQSGIFWYCFKIIIEVFQHLTLSTFLSCGNSLVFMSPDVLVQIRFSHIFLTALNFCLKWYWIIKFLYRMFCDFVSDSTWFWTSSVHLCQHPRNSNGPSSLWQVQRKTKWTLQY